MHTKQEQGVKRLAVCITLSYIPSKEQGVVRMSDVTMCWHGTKNKYTLVIVVIVTDTFYMMPT
jgi:hypothetical protein